MESVTSGQAKAQPIRTSSDTAERTTLWRQATNKLFSGDFLTVIIFLMAKRPQLENLQEKYLLWKTFIDLKVSFKGLYFCIAVYRKIVVCQWHANANFCCSTWSGHWETQHAALLPVWSLVLIIICIDTPRLLKLQHCTPWQKREIAEYH